MARYSSKQKTATSKRFQNPGSPALKSSPRLGAFDDTLSTKLVSNLTLKECDEFITPSCLQALYNIDYTPKETNRNTFGVVEFTPQAYLQTDLGIVVLRYCKPCM